MVGNLTQAQGQHLQKEVLHAYVKFSFFSRFVIDTENCEFLCDRVNFLFFIYIFMNLNNKLARASTLFASAALLAACGGGGSSSPAPAPVAFSTAQVKALASIGVNTAELLFVASSVEGAFLGDTFNGFATGVASGSSSVSNLSCISAGAGAGSFSVNLTKSGVYIGLKSNDTLALIFNGCRFGTSTMTLNGQVVITAIGTIQNLSTTNYSIAYTANSSNLDFTVGPVKFRSNGTQFIALDTTAGGLIAPNIKATAGTGRNIGFFNAITDLAPTINYALSSNTAIIANLTATTYVSKTDGAISVSTPSGTIPISFANSVAFSGAAGSAGLSPTAGNLQVKDTSSGLLTQVTVQGPTVTLQADTNADGTLDSTINTTYANIKAGL